MLVVLVNLIGLNTWAMREQASLSAQRRAVGAVLTDTFPNTTVVVDAPLERIPVFTRDGAVLPVVA